MSSHRTLEVTLISAKDLKNVNLFSNLEVYAVAGLSCDPRGRQRTPADREGRRDPSWNATLRFDVPASADPSRTTLDVLLRAERALGDRDVGEVHVPLAELEAGPAGGKRFVSYQVRRRTGSAKGVLNFSYRFAEPEKAEPRADEPVTAYPVYPQPGSYPPPQAYSGYQQPPVAGAYGHGYTYGYGTAPAVRPPQPQRPPKRNNFGMGLGAGLLGGALGGLLIGDIVSDAAAYDAGFEDAAFDF